MTSKSNDPAAEIEVGVSVIASPAVQHRITKQHFRAGAFFADNSTCMESEIAKAHLQNDARKPQHRAYVVGAIVSAVMGLEACINEVYLDACDKNRTNLAGIDEGPMSLLALWWPQIERKPILFKYEHTLLLLGKPQLPRGANPYQEADHLIHLRNALTHYKAEWDDSLDVHDDLQCRLTGKFDLNPLSTKDALWFPHQCLGSGCANWAMAAAKELVRAFCESLGISNRIQ